MTKLQKYILFILLPPFLTIVTGLALLAIMTQSLTQLDMLIERGQSIWTVLNISLLATPQFMAIVAPVAIFATVSTVYTRLLTENEIVVAFAAGKSHWKIAEPAIRMATVCAIFVLIINVFVQPFTHRIMREKIFAIRSDIATTLVREGQFREPIQGLTIYTRKVGAGNIMSGLVISDSRNPLNPTTFVAKQGSIVKIRGTAAISMLDGSVHRKNLQGGSDILGFSQYILELSDFALEDREIFFKPSDRYTHHLFAPDMTNYWDRTHIGALSAEAHRRFSSPLISVAAAFLGIFAVFGTSYSRRGYLPQILKASTGLLVLLLFQAGGQTAFVKNESLNFIQYLVPIGVIFYISWRIKLFKNWGFILREVKARLNNSRRIDTIEKLA